MTSIKIDRLDGLSSSVAIKGPCRVVATANILLTGLQTIDGVSLVAGDRVLVAGQASASENGIYVVDTGPWRRARDFNKTRDVVKGTQILITDGAVYAQSGWYVASDDPIYVGTSDITILQSIILNPAQLELLVQAAQEAADAAQSAETAAEDAADRAEAAAANINLPAIGTGDPGQIITINSDKTGYEFNTAGIVVETRTILKALHVFFKSAYLTESGREGTFVLKAGSPPVSDTQEGVYVVSNTAGYYWERIYAPAIAPTVRAFGAALDGVTNDSNAIKGALAVCRIAIVPFTASGFVAGDIGLSPNRGETIMAPIRTIWKLPATAQCAVLLGWNEVAEQYAYLENFIFDGSAAPNTSGAIRVNTSAYVVSGFRAKRLIFKDCGFAYQEETSASNFTVDFEFVDCETFYTRGRQVYSHRSRGFFRFRDFRINNVYNPYAGRPEVTWNSAYFGDVLGLELFGFDVVGPAPGAPNNPAYQSGAVGLYIDGITAGRGSIYGSRILVDSTNGPGIILANLFNIQWDQIQVYGCLGAGIGMTNVSKSTFSKVKCYGAKGTTNAPASAAGITMQNCAAVTLDVAEVENFTGSGVVHVASTDCQVNGGYSNNNTGYGYYDDSAGDRNRRVGVTARGNTGGSLFQDKASHATYSWTPNSGTPTASTIGAATVA
ncbi:hypothetical protein [Brucella anthropi]|uniref:hypothetical protein n=1 Tax=Brucella anthropi TaxID=529 RepID=UPI00384BEC28